ncbi:ATP-binding protein [Flavobacterium sp. FlaQc-47]|uniref:ATP-binding protein n=1 Tax=Flavobacterium sp. FlaQc-47 TaxID=3374180 RepID=UPI003757CB06
MEDFRQALENIAKTDIFEVAQDSKNFIGNPFKIDYDKTSILTCDDWKHNVGGIAQGCFLLAFYENDFGGQEVHEAILLRALKPCSIPSDNNVISSRIEYFKEELKTSGQDRQIDSFTRFEFSCSGLECSILGTFYKNSNGNIEFGADIENFYSPHLYKVYKPSGKYLRFIANLRDTDGPLMPDSNFQIGTVRYSSTRQNLLMENNKNEEVLMHTKDILGKRTALFGMTRTGKSNTVKKLIDATVLISQKAPLVLQKSNENFDENSKAFNDKEQPKYPVGQLIFDINGEYANKNLQDGTAIFEKYTPITKRYSILEKKEKGFEIMKVNFYSDVQTGFEYILQFLNEDNTIYLGGFKVIDFTRPQDDDFNGWNIYNKHKSIYFCCLQKAGFDVPHDLKVKIKSNAEIDSLIAETDKKLDVSKELTLSEAYYFWEIVWKNRNHECFARLKKTNKGKEWLTEEIKSLLVMLFQKTESGAQVGGYQKLKIASKLHTSTTNASFQVDITNYLRLGNIVIVDLSQGNPQVQKIFSEKICQNIFNKSMESFIEAKPNNFIQFYFEEAHNLFPKKDDKDLSLIYNRIAKEGAKLNLGMIYATQEVSSISSNILKNTQNWFISHLNNDDEVRELRKFYDFSDFADSLIRFSPKNDKGFVRMKTYSNPFVVPVQIDLFK